MLKPNLAIHTIYVKFACILMYFCDYRSQLAAHVVVLLLFLLAWSTAAASVVTPAPYSTILSCIHVAICTALGTTVLLYFCAGRGDVAAEWKAFADPRQWISPSGGRLRIPLHFPDKNKNI